MKQILGIGVICLLAGILIFNMMDKNQDDTSINHTADIQDDDGAAIVAGKNDKVVVGKKAPDIKLKTLDGKTVQLSDYQGQKVFLNFWASWCGPCKLEMPEMEAFYKKHHDDVVVLGVNTETNQQKVKDFITKNGYTYPILLDQDGEVSNLYNIYGLPTTYFIGTDGKIQQTPKIGPMTKSFMIEMLDKLD